MNINILKPLYEFGALMKYCEEKHLTNEMMSIHTGMPDLSRTYYKVLDRLSGHNLEMFEHEVQKAYERLVIAMDSYI